jgi:hypothetical protein
MKVRCNCVEQDNRMFREDAEYEIIPEYSESSMVITVKDDLGCLRTFTRDNMRIVVGHRKVNTFAEVPLFAYFEVCDGP